MLTISGSHINEIHLLPSSNFCGLCVIFPCEHTISCTTQQARTTQQVPGWVQDIQESTRHSCCLGFQSSRGENTVHVWDKLQGNLNDVLWKNALLMPKRQKDKVTVTRTWGNNASEAALNSSNRSTPFLKLECFHFGFFFEFHTAFKWCFAKA